jgi:Outer membrane protein beta-barrel domain
MTRNWTVALVTCAAIGSLADPVAAQGLKPTIFGTVGLANVYRADDRSFGTKLDVGGGLGVERKRLAFDADVHRTIGLTPRTVQCATTLPCTGSAREGFTGATMLSGDVSYLFGEAKVRPYLTGSVGVLRATSVNTVTIASSTSSTLSETRDTDTGLALGVGFGVDVPLSTGLSLRPEFRTYSSTALSRMNLGLHRGSIGVRYRW